MFPKASTGAAVVVAAVALTAASATADAAKKGGTLHVDLFSDVDYTDPALAYSAVAWELEFATCLKLVNYADVNGPKGSLLAPEAATGLPKVSNGGKTYDFTVEVTNTRFAPSGARVTAASFKAAFDRNADRTMHSPAIQFMDDVVGADASPVTGVRVSGKHLIVDLERPSPDFLARVAMPFFCAIPTNLPHDPNGVLAPPSAGPYYVADRTPNRTITIKKNPYYKGKRPHNVAEIVYTPGVSQEAIRLRVEHGDSDYAAGGVPAPAYGDLAQKYGINKGQFHVRPRLNTFYFAFNNDRPIFKGNLRLRRAINFAIDRKAILAQNGYLAGKRTDQVLPPGMAGFKDADLYPLKAPNLKAARKWAQGATRGGKLVYYAFNTSAAAAISQIFAFNVKQIGLETEVSQFAGSVLPEKVGTRGEPFDVALLGWTADYADPYTFIDVLLNGKNIRSSHNSNVSYFNSPSFNRKLDAAARTGGAERYSSYGNLDVDISKNGAPWAAYSNFNTRIFVSERVGCFTTSPVYVVNLAALCLK
jgi:ABC-type oligopeptide transport system substrate-binding subunit